METGRKVLSQGLEDVLKGLQDDDWSNGSKQQELESLADRLEAAGMNFPFYADLLFGNLPYENGEPRPEYVSRIINAVLDVAQRRSSVHSPILLMPSGWRHKDDQLSEGAIGATELKQLFRRLGEQWTELDQAGYLNYVRTQQRLPERCIVPEEEAKTTEQNAQHFADFVGQVRGALAAALNIQEKLIPLVVSGHSTDYHNERMAVREQLLPEKSERQIIKTALPGCVFRAVPSFYLPLTSTDNHTRCFAKIFRAAHLFPDALLANLWGLYDEKVSELRLQCVDRCLEGWNEMSGLWHKLLKIKCTGGARPAQFELVTDALKKYLPTLRAFLAGDVRDALGNSMTREQWGALASQLSNIINPIRRVSSPDIRI